MKYFIFNHERKGTCYHEFYKGKWDNETFWKEDSLLLHDDVLFENREFAEAIFEVIPEYSEYGVTEISREQWKQIGEVAVSKTKGVRELYLEADAWLSKVFEEEDCFTILGI